MTISARRCAKVRCALAGAVLTVAAGLAIAPSCRGSVTTRHRPLVDTGVGQQFLCRWLERAFAHLVHHACIRHRRHHHRRPDVRQLPPDYRYMPGATHQRLIRRPLPDGQIPGNPRPTDAWAGGDTSFGRVFPRTEYDRSGRAVDAPSIRRRINGVKMGQAAPDTLPALSAAGHEEASSVFRLVRNTPSPIRTCSFPCKRRPELRKQLVPDWLAGPALAQSHRAESFRWRSACAASRPG